MDIASFSAKGSRQVNEDSFSVCRKGGALCVTVCDGLGGHAAGQTASKAVAEAFKAVFEGEEVGSEDFFEIAFDSAFRSLAEMAAADPSLAAMKTTAVSLVADDNSFRFANIGDSRLYAFRGGRAEQLSTDHSYTQMLVLSGKISRSQIRNHPDRNILLRAMGTEEERSEFDASPLIPLGDYEAFLLCTDGFWELINERKMARALFHSSGAADWINRMKKTVCRKGARKAMDNFTAVGIIINKTEG